MNITRCKWFLFGVVIALSVMPVAQGANKKEAPLPLPSMSPAQPPSPDANKKEGPSFWQTLSGWIILPTPANKKE
jgi:hypothetical protein